MDTADPFDFIRFLTAQDGIYETALRELRAGQKRSHWMWYIFPQLEGLGTSYTARRYAIKSFDEARAYLQHPVLGVRLIECTQSVVALQGRTLQQIFWSPDDLKFCSSMTLFERVAGAGSVFAAALDKYCSGARDALTLKLLQS
ncbi:MAG: DUF1810 domain-containing protein [Rhodocyclales bacterium]|nr:DUF1810 domain-containing protein [Rhodocyclales bacterium]